MNKTIMAYFKLHPMYSGAVHLIAGIGIGALLAYPIFGLHPVRWGIGLIALAILGKVYPLMMKK